MEICKRYWMLIGKLFFILLRWQRLCVCAFKELILLGRCTEVFMVK